MAFGLLSLYHVVISSLDICHIIRITRARPPVQTQVHVEGTVTKCTNFALNIVDCVSTVARMIT